MLTVTDFVISYPTLALNFDVEIRRQPRIKDDGLLADLPEQLQPIAKYSVGGRGRANRNQTRTHAQCRECRRVLRNDFFGAGYDDHICNDCRHVINARAYEKNGETWKRRRGIIWDYIAPMCVICGFNQHSAALDMHHLGNKEGLVSKMVAHAASAPIQHNIERLLNEAAKCVPLCANCHRLLHAGVISLPENVKPLSYSVDELLSLLHTSELGSNGYQQVLIGD